MPLHPPALRTLSAADASGGSGAGSQERSVTTQLVEIFLSAGRPGSVGALMNVLPEALALEFAQAEASPAAYL